MVTAMRTPLLLNATASYPVTDDTNCYDAYLGQTSFFELDREDGSFDYDGNQKQEPREISSLWFFKLYRWLEWLGQRLWAIGGL